MSRMMSEHDYAILQGRIALPIPDLALSPIDAADPLAVDYCDLVPQPQEQAYFYVVFDTVTNKALRHRRAVSALHALWHLFDERRVRLVQWYLDQDYPHDAAVEAARRSLDETIHLLTPEQSEYVLRPRNRVG